MVFGGQIIRNGDETLPYLPLDKVRQSSSKLVGIIITIMYENSLSKLRECFLSQLQCVTDLSNILKASDKLAQ